MLKRWLISLLIPLFFLLTAPSAKAQSQQWNLGQIGPSKGEIVGGIVGAAAGLAVTGYLIYHYSHRGRSLRGCAVASAGGLQIVNEGDQRSYDLTGETAMIKTGDRVRVSGKKVKGDPNHRQFVVTKLSKDYGACRVAPATP
jgi:hypothetical protein